MSLTRDASLTQPSLLVFGASFSMISPLDTPNTIVSKHLPLDESKSRDSDIHSRAGKSGRRFKLDSAGRWMSIRERAE